MLSISTKLLLHAGLSFVLELPFDLIMHINKICITKTTIKVAKKLNKYLKFDIFFIQAMMTQYSKK